MSTDMSKREHRLKTFKSKWFHNSITRKEMAKRGFYLIRDYEVKCFFCDKIFVTNRNMNDIFVQHDMQSPECKMTSNIEVDRALSNLSISVEIGDKPINISIPDNEPNYPDFKTVNSRLQSFKDWPKSMGQSPEDLTDAGFFYIGKGDKVLCHSCGGGIHNWESDDDPWTQHIIWYRYCQYVQEKKNINEIEKALRKRFGSSVADGGQFEPQSEIEIDQSNLPNIDIAEGLPIRTTDDLARRGEIMVEKAREKLFRGNTYKNACKICISNEINTVFFPCAHIVTCHECSELSKNCVICKRKIKQTKKVFFE